jgi:hypothetical protein
MKLGTLSVTWQILKAKIRATVVHAIVTIVIALLSAVLVFCLWYPDQLAFLMEGANLYLLILAVEVCLGPLMSLVVYNPEKSARELWVDYSLVVLIQLAALSYGLYSTFNSRPVYQVLVIDRFEMVGALELNEADLNEATADFSKLPISGPITICVDRPTGVVEKNALLLSALNGRDIELLPRYYRHCHEGEVLAVAYDRQRLLSALSALNRLEDLASKLPAGEFSWIPVKSRIGIWVQIFPNESPRKPYYLDFNPFM